MERDQESTWGNENGVVLFVVVVGRRRPGDSGVDDSLSETTFDVANSFADGQC